MQRIEIRVKEQMDERWVDWLEGLEIQHANSGETILTGSVPDQAALFGLMTKLRDLGVTLISVNSHEYVQAGPPDGSLS
jgi:hypothetical protein